MAGSWWVVSGDSSPKYWLRFWCMKCYHFAKSADAFLYWLMLRTRFPSVSTNEASTLCNALTLGVLEWARQTGLVSANQLIHFQKKSFFFPPCYSDTQRVHVGICKHSWFIRGWISLKHHLCWLCQLVKLINQLVHYVSYPGVSLLRCLVSRSCFSHTQERMVGEDAQFQFIKHQGD